jgi:hypothetical protein
MKIEWTPSVRTSRTRRDERGAGSGDSFAGQVSSDSSPAPASGPSTLAAVDGLFALQEVPDPVTGRRRAVARGTALLDHLEDLRIALLTGAVPRQRLQTLAQLMREQIPLNSDARLAVILEEIELRVAVELAKLGESV